MEDFPAMSDSNVNISDVLAAIETTDPLFAEQNRADIEVITELRAPQAQTMQQQPGNNNRAMPRVEIIEQPASKALRFRYECEGRSAGSIPGVSSTPENKTFPSIRILGYKGRAIVVVSCVTKDFPYRPHPHNLVGKEVCRDGVCTVEVSSENMTVSFDKLGIQCVKRKDIEDALKHREQIRVDPFRTGFDHKRQPSSIDLNAVRLCFQVFLEGPVKGKFKVPLTPVVSDPIYDKKAMSDLVICKLSHCSASVAGGTEMVLLCEKVAKEDIQVRFFEESNGQIVYEGFGDFQPTSVHKQVAIAFRTPSYRSQHVDQPVRAFIQLRRPSDGATSEALEFQFLPLGLEDPDYHRRKIPKLKNSPKAYMLQQIQAEAEKNTTTRTIGYSEQGLMQPMQPQYNFNLIKTEPADRSPYHQPVGSPSMFDNTNMGGLQPMHSPHRTPSPMECNMYNLPPAQPYQNMANQLQPINIPQTSPSPVLQHEPLTVPDNSYNPGNPNNLSNAIGNAMNLGNVFEDQNQQPIEFNLSLSQLDNVDFTSLNISDIVKEAINGEEGAAGMTAEESGMTDSFTKLARNTINDLCSLNNMYKPTGDMN